MSEYANPIPQTDIRKFDFSEDGARAIILMQKGIDWPIVYILTGIGKGQKEVAYVGETSSAHTRITQHLANPERKCMNCTYILLNDWFNKSAVLDIENMLIEHMHVDGKFQLQNLNGGQSKFHNYYQRMVYREIFEEIWKKLAAEHLVKKTLVDIENSNLFKYSPFKQLTDEQYELRDKLLLDIAGSLEKGDKKEIIVEGGAGTGKSVLAVSLLKHIADVLYEKRDFSMFTPEQLSKLESIEGLDYDLTQKLKVNQALSRKKDLRIAFVIPQDSFRKTIQSVFAAVPSLKKLHVDVTGPNDLTKKEGGYDIVIVDEAHRLQSYGKVPNHDAYKKSCKRLGFNDPKQTTQLDWVVRQAKSVLILFYDRMQSISDKDIMPEEFDKLRNNGASEYTISNQIRLIAGKEYIDYWRELLRNNEGDMKPNLSNNNYDFRIYDRFEDMLSDIKKRDREYNGLCRVLSGYGFKCSQGKNDTRTQKDIVIDGVDYYWNDKDDVNYVNNSASVGDIGCVHKVQGFDLNYAGVVFAPDIEYVPGKGIQPVKKNYHDRMSRSSVAGRTEKNILNSYLVLLTRGIRGTYIYCCDKKLQQYFIDKLGAQYVRQSSES